MDNEEKQFAKIIAVVGTFMIQHLNEHHDMETMEAIKWVSELSTKMERLFSPGGEVDGKLDDMGKLISKRGKLSKLLEKMESDPDNVDIDAIKKEAEKILSEKHPGAKVRKIEIRKKEKEKVHRGLEGLNSDSI